MKIMFFSDLENFKGSLKLINKDIRIDYKLIHTKIIEYLISLVKWEKYNPRLIRAYFYTGIYTKTLMSRIKNHYREIEKSNKISKDKKEKTLAKINKCLERSKENRLSQLNEFKDDYNYNFLEFKKLPLQYSKSSIKVFQKGVDVQLAVDLVSHAYSNNYDVAILCSGDMDLLESVKIVKLLGKKIMLVSCPKNTSKEMIGESDYFLNLQNLKEDKLNTLTI